MKNSNPRKRLPYWRLRHAVTIRRIAVTLTTLATLAGLGYLIDRTPQTFLDYARVLAWPLVILGALALFYNPILHLFRDLYLKELNVRSGRLRFDERQEHSDPDALRALSAGKPDALPKGEAAELDLLRYGTKITSALLQTFQIQIDFLKVLEHAPEGLTRSAAVEWFRDELRDKHGDPEQWDVPPLVTWMETIGLLSLDPDGRLVASEYGKNFASFTDSFWYAPKLV